MQSLQNKVKELSSKLSNKTFTELIILGRLGNVVQENGFRFFPNDNFQPLLFEKNKNFFLIFTDDRVRYVSLENITLNSNKYFLTFDDYFVTKEIMEAGRVSLALHSDEFYEESEEELNFVDMVAFYNGEQIGEIDDFLQQSDHYILTIIDTEGKEFMIPAVEDFIESIDWDKRVIFFKNIEDLISL